MQNPKVRIIIREFFNKVSSDDFIKQDVSTIPMRFNELLELQCRKVPPKIFEEITASANSSMLFFREIHNYLFESPRVESKRPEQPLGSGDAAAWFAPVFQAGGARPFQVQALAQPQASGLTTQQKATLPCRWCCFICFLCKQSPEFLLGVANDFVLIVDCN